MNKTKIEWCDSTWNPVTGCLHGCEYCYARKIANRFKGCDIGSTYGYGRTAWKRADNNKELMAGQGTAETPMLFDLRKHLLLPNRLNKAKTAKHGRQIFEYPKAPYPFGFAPTFHRYKLGEPKAKTKPQAIFVCSMADLFGEWVPDEWINAVFVACAAAPQHTYLFLTKNPARYLRLYEKKAFPYSDNIWLGSSVTKPSDEFVWVRNTPYKTFISIEPLLEPFGKLEKGNLPDWVIIGAETGNRKNKVKPAPYWIEEILKECAAAGTPVFMKDSLVSIVGESNMRGELPWRMIKDGEKNA